MSITARVKDLSLSILGLLLMVGFLAVGIALLTGAAAFSIWILKWTFPAFLITLLLSVFLLGPLALIRRTRAFSAGGFMIASFAFGAILWIWGMAYTYSVWGLFAVMVGLVFLGVGVVPVAMVAALVHGDWANLASFIITAVLIFGFRALASWLEEKAEHRTARPSARELEAVYEVFE